VSAAFVFAVPQGVKAICCWFLPTVPLRWIVQDFRNGLRLTVSEVTGRTLRLNCGRDIRNESRWDIRHDNDEHELRMRDARGDDPQVGLQKDNHRKQKWRLSSLKIAMPIGRIRLNLTRRQSGKCLCGGPREDTDKQRHDWPYSPDRNAVETRPKFRHKSTTEIM
jgi:hypothetical protein